MKYALFFALALALKKGRTLCECRIQNAECKIVAKAKCKMQNAKCKIMLAKATAIKFPSETRNVLVILVREMYSQGSYAKCFLWKRGFTPLHFAHKEKYIYFILNAHVVSS